MLPGAAIRAVAEIATSSARIMGRSIWLRPATPGPSAASKPLDVEYPGCRRTADSVLAERCRANVPGAFEEVYRLHAPRLFGLACRMVGPHGGRRSAAGDFPDRASQARVVQGRAALGNVAVPAGHEPVPRPPAKPAARGSRQLADELTTSPPRSAECRCDSRRRRSAGSGAGLAALPPAAVRCSCCTTSRAWSTRRSATLLGISDGTSKSQLHKARHAAARAAGAHQMESR